VAANVLSAWTRRGAYRTLSYPPRAASTEGFFMRAAPAGPRATGDSETANDGAAPLVRLNRFFERLSRSGFYGKIVVSMQNGALCDVKIEQTRKIEEL
jgi:hypothetical protein